MNIKPIVWSIGGSDPSGGAGIQKDLSTFIDFGVYGCSVITILTAQNSYYVKSTVPCDFNIVASQIDTLHFDLQPDAIKLGALGSKAAVVATAKYLQDNEKTVICDPVFNASVGGELLNSDAIDLLVKTIFPSVTLLTPNIAEAERLTNMSIHCHGDMELAAEKILALGVNSVLIKGSHVTSSVAADYFCSEQNSFWLQSPMQDKSSVRGTGCLLSSAIAASMALGYDLYDAIVIGKMYINQSIRNSVLIGKGCLFSQHFGWPKQQQDLPWITTNIREKRFLFPNCNNRPIGFYPIVDSVAWIKKLISQGVKTIQLRIKKQPIEKVEQAIKNSVELCKANNVRLFINDYWQLAMKYRAYGVHLGQDDLKTADFHALEQSGIHLGMSTHCFYEVAKAHAYRPSYIAFGPIYDTTTKVMRFTPRGLKQLSYWNQLLRYPVVAIGGINQDRLSAVLATGVDGVSVISAVTKSTNPDEAIHYFLDHIEAKEHVQC